MNSFHFQNFEIWMRGVKINRVCYDIADLLEARRMFRFTEQLLAAALSITNNIAEGSGCSSNADFAIFLNFSRKSVFEMANMLQLLTVNS